MERPLVEVRVHARLHLRVSSVERAREMPPVAIPPVGAAVHLDEARAGGGHDDLSVGGAVPHPERVQHRVVVRDEILSLDGRSVDGEQTEVNAERSVGGTLVVHPHGRRLVLAVAGDRVDDVLLALQELLAKHLGAETAVHGLDLQYALEVPPRLVDVVTQLHAVGPRAVGRLENHGILLALQECLHVRELPPGGLADGSHPRGLDQLLLHFLVPPVRVVARGAVRSHHQPFREQVGRVHARLAAAHARDDAQLPGGLVQVAGRLAHVVALGHLGVVAHRAAAHRHVRLHLLREAFRPESDHLVPPALYLLHDHAPRGVRIHDHDDLLRRVDGREPLPHAAAQLRPVLGEDAEQARPVHGEAATVRRRRRARGGERSETVRGGGGPREALPLGLVDEEAVDVLEVPDEFDVPLQHGVVVVHEYDARRAGDEVDRELDLRSDLHPRRHAYEAREPPRPSV